ncbi:MAG: type II toxin-antitoxin system HigB family toxin [Acidobacteria bacterium]|nr:type II toxin-antitoxin system HigB family toxin [Acidobacteriota bacterium]
MRVLGEATAARFAKKHAGARKPLQRSLTVARKAEWPHFPAVKQTFPATDLGKRSGRLIFDIGGNNYRLIASVDFREQILAIERVLTHEEYSQEVL